MDGTIIGHLMDISTRLGSQAEELGHLRAGVDGIEAHLTRQDERLSQLEEVALSPHAAAWVVKRQERDQKRSDELGQSKRTIVDKLWYAVVMFAFAQATLRTTQIEHFVTHLRAHP